MESEGYYSAWNEWHSLFDDRKDARLLHYLTGTTNGQIRSANGEFKSANDDWDASDYQFSWFDWSHLLCADTLEFSMGSDVELTIRNRKLPRFLNEAPTNIRYKLVGLRSFFDSGGGLHLRNLGRNQPHLTGTFTLDGGHTIIDPIQIYQDNDHLTIWFDTEAELPLPDWDEIELPGLHTTLWLERSEQVSLEVPSGYERRCGKLTKKSVVAGIRFNRWKLPMRYKNLLPQPIEEFSIHTSDFSI